MSGKKILTRALISAALISTGYIYSEITKEDRKIENRADICGITERREEEKQVETIIGGWMERMAESASEEKEEEMGAESEISRGKMDWEGNVSDKPGEEYKEYAAQVIKKRYDSESTNEKWTDAVRSKAENILYSTEMEKTKLSSVECHETICMVKLEHDDEESWREFRDRGMDEALDVPWCGDIVEENNDSNRGGMTTTMYFPGKSDRKTITDMKREAIKMVSRGER